MIKGEITRKLLLAAVNFEEHGEVDNGVEFEKWYKSQNKYGRYRIRKAFGELQKRGLIDTSRDSSDEMRVSLTGAGHKEVLKYKLDSVNLVPLPKWDGRWRIVIAGEMEPRVKNSLRSRFKKLGLRQIQKNIWAYPHSCDKEVSLVANAFNVAHKIKFLEADFVSDDSELKLFFGLA